MQQNTFGQLVWRHFGYLVSEYGFFIAEEMSDPAPEGNGFVEFRSNVIFVDVSVDRGQVSVDLGPYPVKACYKFELGTVIWYLMLARFPDCSLMEQTYTGIPERPQGVSQEGYVDLQLAKLASLLKQFCGPILEGEFSQWPEMARATREAVAAYYKRRTGLDYPEGAA